MENSDTELLTKTLQVEHKLFYFDLKENPRGRYLKISEKTSGSRSTIIVPLDGVAWFADLFNYYASNDGQELYSKELQLDIKVFYFDVGENKRGRFLRVSEASVSRSRSTIIVPAGNDSDGWSAFRDVLAEIHKACSLIIPTQQQQASATSEQLQLRGLSDPVAPGFISVGSSQENSVDGGMGDKSMGLAGGESGGVVMAKVIRAEQKRFFFDLGSNSRGQFLRISEVTGSDRSVIILPVSVLEQFHDALGQFVDITRSQGLTGSSLPNVRTIASANRRSEN
ncbi:transcription factor Pur-alpha 1 isoform X1 [Cryptomeria japonica]|uniref:transcription factor Pur-alpha 1 isoform X1 n=1 Tax=Cryptomeria japonica TaxID=3369 RepID=UPI0027DA0C97|nr:transcription factor Pur-alpha 1 isoform X1 [Cryptomeria japonica]